MFMRVGFYALRLKKWTAQHFLGVGFYASKHLYACIPIFLCTRPYVSMLEYLSILVTLCFYAHVKLWIKKFKKYIQNGFQIVHKNVTNLVVETVSELDLRVKNYSEKIKEMMSVCVHACMCQVAGVCMCQVAGA
jgi:hypothetical protein